MKVYTLKNCDTCKKALKWLDQKNVTYDNHDVRADGVDLALIGPIVEALGWEVALNRRSTTWRGLSDEQKENIDNGKAIALILEHPTLMKRPIFVEGDVFSAGFDAKGQTSVEGML